MLIKEEKFTWSATAYKIAIIQGKQQQTAIPTTQANATQNTTKKTSKIKNNMQSLHRNKKNTRILLSTFLINNYNAKWMKHWFARVLDRPVKLGCIMDQCLATRRYPVESNDPPYEWEKCICRFQIFHHTTISILTIQLTIIHK